MGVFDPEHREAAITLLECMDFPGVKKLVARLKNGETGGAAAGGGSFAKQEEKKEYDPIRAAFSGAERLAERARDTE